MVRRACHNYKGVMNAKRRFSSVENGDERKKSP